jgi:hypothetical protein
MLCYKQMEVILQERDRLGRLDLLDHFHKKGFIRILVNFDIPDDILQERVAKSKRSTKVFRIASSFKEVLTRQQEESFNPEIALPTEGESDYLFVITNTDEVQSVTQNIIDIAQG